MMRIFAIFWFGSRRGARDTWCVVLKYGTGVNGTVMNRSLQR